MGRFGGKVQMQNPWGGTNLGEFEKWEENQLNKDEPSMKISRSVL